MHAENKKSIQQQMDEDIQNASLFTQAQNQGLEYVLAAKDRNVFPTQQALDDLIHFDGPLGEEYTDAEQVIQTLHRYGSPATVTYGGGRYFGFVNGSMVPAGLAAKNLSIFWDQNTAMQVLSPICSKLESVVQSWLIDLFGLPVETVAGFVSGTSMANFCGLAAARYRLLHNQGWDIVAKGLIGAPPLRVVTGREAHSTILKAISMIGLGRDNIEWVDTDDQGRIITDQIPQLDDSTLLILQAGNVHSGSYDDFSAICQRAREQGAWIHIDGAFGLWAAAVHKLTHLTAGMHHAHSWAVDGHKTLNTPYDSGIVLCSDSDALVSALHMTGGYIIKGADRDGMYYTPEMSRRARIVELWATLKFLGKQGIDEMIYGLHERAVQFGNLLSGIPGFTVMNDIVFNQVVVRCDSDELTDAVIAAVQEERVCWVGGSQWQGRRVIRISVCAWVTTAEDVELSVASFERALDRCRGRS